MVDLSKFTLKSYLPTYTKRTCNLVVDLLKFVSKSYLLIYTKRIISFIDILIRG